MDGNALLYSLRNLLEEDSGSTFLDTRTSYEFLYEAACDFCDETQCLKSSQTITTVAEQTDYTLNADFLRLYMRDTDNKYFLKLSDGSTTSFIAWEDYQDFFYTTSSTSVTRPNYFAIIDDSQDSQATGTATSTSTATGGKSTLTDTAGDFSDVSAGDPVNNTTDGSSGYVISKTSSTVLQVALFGGTNNLFTSGDAYIIQPQGRMKIILDPAPSTAGYTITVPYVQRPNPVFTSYDSYRFQSQYMKAIVKYAAWLYKYRDREPNYGDAWFKFWDREIRKAQDSLDQSLNRQRFTVNFRKRNGRR